MPEPFVDFLVLVYGICMAIAGIATLFLIPLALARCATGH